ncbi:glycine betaine/L-proline ABC transporter ATP-binding protein ProV [Salinisphaera sp. USBA-960]|uniref:glycine betaine/L-proline ABC transporter ATP-binding protein ProV n=1 Tax=Salinisphaera orenii TaxID=856731 RepID=UPI000DBE7AEF|nr:glycine betaine/L-proline ABC transporter ATP-binding protein ProV [Salifodinibacter halophilus]NNC25404.1 glycine betaine/L-proline ABC transporter ATP-binding protein ProV [Salifodinibacter halophilus]
MNPKLTIENLYKVFGPEPQDAIRRVERGENKNDIFAATGSTVGVSDANFEIFEGEVFVVMGLSGSGKSTLVRMLNRLIDSTQGRITLDGRDVTNLSQKELTEIRRREMSMVFQSFALMPHQTVLENTKFGLSVSGIGRQERDQRALEALEAVGLKANANSYPDELSGGMKQRVGLARALAINPGVLLMDEAFSALDPLIRTEMQDELLRLQKEQRRTVVFITHDLDEAMRVGDRIAMMEGGRIVQVGSPNEIVREPADEYVSSFFKGVDVSYVFAAEDVASRDEAALLTRDDHDIASARAEVKAHARALGVMVDADGAFQGLVTADSLAAIDDNAGFDAAFVDDVVTVERGEALSTLVLRVADSTYPVVVRAADNGRYCGLISSRLLLHTLSREDDEQQATNNNNEAVA